MPEEDEALARRLKGQKATRRTSGQQPSSFKEAEENNGQGDRGSRRSKKRPLTVKRSQCDNLVTLFIRMDFPYLDDDHQMRGLLEINTGEKEGLLFSIPLPSLWKRRVERDKAGCVLAQLAENWGLLGLRKMATWRPRAVRFQ